MVIQTTGLRRLADRTVVFHQLRLESSDIVPKSCSVGVERRRIVGLAEKRLQGEEDRLHAINSRPFVLQNIKADRAASEVDVWVITWCVKLDGRCYIWVICREGNGYFECESSINSLRGAFYRSDPFEKVPIMLGERRNARGGRHHKSHQFAA